MPSIDETKPKILKKVGTKKPKTAREIALALGYSSHHPISHALAACLGDGSLEKVGTGYIRKA